MIPTLKILLIFIALLVSTTSTAAVTPQEDDVLQSLSMQIATCSCSPSDRGFRKVDAQNLQLALIHVHKIIHLTEPRLGTRIAKKAAYLYGISKFQDCVRTQNYEACVNADAALRAPGFRTFCTYNQSNFRNLNLNHGKFQALRPCNKMPKFASSFEQRGGSTSVQLSTPAPKSGSFMPVLPADSASPSPRPSSITSVIPDDLHVKKHAESQKKSSRRNGTAVIPLPSRAPIDPKPTILPVATPAPAKEGNNSPLMPKKKHKNEGCIAVEHLNGYVLQHSQHLLRYVLCADGFCATPNHGIIVNGTYTSMKRLCQSKVWTCTEDLKLVNNLKISANRHAAYGSHVVITPYDVRFPAPLIWAVQIFEDIWFVFSMSVVTGAAMSSALIVAVQIRLSGKQRDGYVRTENFKRSIILER